MFIHKYNAINHIISYTVRCILGTYGGDYHKLIQYSIKGSRTVNN